MAAKNKRTTVPGLHGERCSTARIFWKKHAACDVTARSARPRASKGAPNKLNNSWRVGGGSSACGQVAKLAAPLQDSAQSQRLRRAECVRCNPIERNSGRQMQRRQETEHGGQHY